MNEVRLLARSARLPFVVAVGGNEAAPAPDGVFERRLFQNRFGTRVDQQAEVFGILDPGGQQTPTHQAEMPGALFLDHHSYRLCRSNIIPRREIWLLDIVEKLPQCLRGRADYKASAHSPAQLGIRS